MHNAKEIGTICCYTVDQLSKILWQENAKETIMLTQ